MIERILRSRSRGQALPLVAVCLVALLGFVALAVDVGAEQYRQRAQQTATDAAALAGASEVTYSGSSTDITAAAQNDAASNGFANDGAQTTVTVNYPPVSGNLTGNTSAVQVVISTVRNGFFGGVLGQASQTVNTTATAVLTSNGTAPCVYALDPGGSFVENSGTVYAPTCGIIANGSSKYTGGTITAASVGYAGSITVNNTTFVQASPAPSIPAADPCAQIAGCAYLTDNPPSTESCLYNNLIVTTAMTLQPGVYCGGMTVNAANVTMTSGRYVFTGGVTFNGACTVTGTGVTLVMDSGSITMNGGGTITLSAPTTGTDAGVLFYQPKSNTSSPTLNAGAMGSLIGALYFPGATVTGNSSGDYWTLLIAGSITLNSAKLKGPNGKGMTGGVQNVVLAE